MEEGVWTNGKKKVIGWWQYNWASDNFLIILKSKDRITGDNRRIMAYGDTPEWGNWKRVKD